MHLLLDTAPNQTKKDRLPCRLDIFLILLSFGTWKTSFMRFCDYIQHSIVKQLIHDSYLSNGSRLFLLVQLQEVWRVSIPCKKRECQVLIGNTVKLLVKL